MAEIRTALDEMAGALAVNDCFAVSDEFTIVTGQATRVASV